MNEKRDLFLRDKSREGTLWTDGPEEAAGADEESVVEVFEGEAKTSDEDDGDADASTTSWEPDASTSLSSSSSTSSSTKGMSSSILS